MALKKFLLILGVLGVSFSAIFVRLSTAPSLVMVLYRVSMAVIILAPFVLFKFRDELKKLKLRHILLCLLSGLFLGLHFTVYFEALQYTGIASAVVLVDTEVFFVAFAMLLIFKERISRGGWLGIIIAFAGSVVIALSDALGSGSGGGGGESNVLLGDGLALLGALLMAVYTMIGKVLRRELSTTVYTFLAYFAAAVTVCVIALIGGTPLLGYDKSNWLIALGLAVFCTILGHSVFSWGLKYVQAAYVSNVKLLEPVFATILGIFLFKEIPSLPVVIGGVVVIVGVLICSRYQSGELAAGDAPQAQADEAENSVTAEEPEKP